MGLLGYLFEANVYLIVTFLVYFFLLKKKTHYHFNRWFLIASTIIAFVMPLINLNTQKVEITESTISFKPRLAITENINSSVNLVKNDQISNTVSFWDVLVLLYFIISIFLLVKLVTNITKIVKLYRRSDKRVTADAVHIYLPSEQNVFSFFNWLFYHPSVAKQEAIILHEMVHIRGKHSLDLLFYDLVIAFNWFNPFVYQLFKEIKINHEFIADQETISITGDKYGYAKLLIAYIAEPNFRLGHTMSNGSQLEQRIIHLSCKKSPGLPVFKSLLVLPLLFILSLIFGFTLPKQYSLLVYHISSSSTLTRTKINNLAHLKRDSHGELEKSSPIERTYYVSSSADTFNKAATKSIKVADSPKKAAPKRKIIAMEVMYDWLKNPTRAQIRQISHSIFEGSEAQLFRGQAADTLYAEPGFYEIMDDHVEIKASQLMVSKNQSTSQEKKLIVIDSRQRKVIAVLPQVLIKTKGMIHEVKEILEEGKLTPKLDLLSYNMRVQYATVNGIHIITEKEDKNAPYQPGILW